MTREDDQPLEFFFAGIYIFMYLSRIGIRDAYFCVQVLILFWGGGGTASLFSLKTFLHCLPHPGHGVNEIDCLSMYGMVLGPYLRCAQRVRERLRCR